MVKKEKLEVLFKVMTISISALALTISIFSFSNSRKSMKMVERENEPNLKIIQNLWSKEPSYELINESSSKLDNVPSPSYFMFVPSKVYLLFEDGSRVSTMVLSPISYDIIDEQIIQNTTKGTIIKSVLPKSFFAKKGEREIIKGETIQNGNFKVYVDTLPFLVIISNIEYQYNNKSENIILLSTPLNNLEINNDDYTNIKEYIKDNANNLEIKTNEENTSIYEIAHEKVEKLTKEIFNTESKINEDNLSILGGKEGGYGSILKKINGLVSPHDPMEN